MERLTTDIPKSNTETLMNYAYAKNGRVYLRYAAQEDDIDLCEYVAHICDRKGCEMTPQDIMDGGCLGCECDISVLYAVAVQAAELRARLKYYEDMEEQGRLIQLSCNVGDTVWLLRQRCKYAGEQNKPRESCRQYWDNIHYKGMWGCGGEDDEGKMFPCEKEELVWYALKMKYELFLCAPHIVLGKNLFLTREEAEQALKGGADHE